MFGTDRKALRQQYLNTWQKYQHQQHLEPLEILIAEVIQQHPEYHPLLQDNTLDQDFTPEHGQSNPFLHMGLHIAIREQISSDRPAGIRALSAQLIAHYRDQHRAEHAMLDCLGETLWEAQRQQRLPDEQRYLERLRGLFG